jgi:hypothetical protein
LDSGLEQGYLGVISDFPQVFFLFRKGNSNPTLLLGGVSGAFDAVEPAGEFGIDAFDRVGGGERNA